MNTIDDFNGQSNGTSPDGWTIVNTGDAFEIDTTTVYEGDACLYVEGSGSSTRAEGYKTFSTLAPMELKFIFRMNYESRSNDDGRQVYFEMDDTSLITVQLDTNGGDNDIDFAVGNSATYSFGSTQTWYEVYIKNVDYTDYSFDCVISKMDGTEVFSISNVQFNNNGSQINSIRVRAKGWGACGMRVDNFEYYACTPPTVSADGVTNMEVVR